MSTFKNLQWVKPSQEVVNDSRSIFSPIVNRLSNSARQREALFSIGVPIPEVTVGQSFSAKDYAIHLLKIAAEVEHALMVQYLYAAGSIEDDEDEIGEQSATLSSINKGRLAHIGIEEMAHLATVQNLLLLLGGPSAFYMQRDLLRLNSDQDVTPFILEPVSQQSLAIYTLAERPMKLPFLLQKKIKKMEDSLQSPPNRVGAIYAVIKWLFMDEESASKWIDISSFTSIPRGHHIHESDLLPEDQIELYIASKQEWGDFQDSFHLEMPKTIPEAIAAIDKINEQGEGMNAGQNSHFLRFVQLYDEFEKGNISVRGVAVSPTITPGLGGGNPTNISNDYTKKWAQVHNIQYEMLCVGILHSLKIPRDTTAKTKLRRELTKVSVDKSMSRVLKSLLDLLSTLPLDTEGSKSCGAPFDLDPEALKFQVLDELPSRHIKMLDDLQTLYAEIEVFPEFIQAHKRVLRRLKSEDRRRRRLFEPLIV